MIRVKFLLLLVIASHARIGYANKHMYELSNSWSVGIDLSQLNYLITNLTPAFNLATHIQYKPINFFSINSVLGYNEVRDERRQGFSSLNHYHSKGGFAKLGFDFSVGINKFNLNERLFMGYQWGYLRFKESGVFRKEHLYWSDFNLPFTRSMANYSAHEFVYGYQRIKNAWGFRIQGFVMHEKPNYYLSHPDNIIDGYRTPFIPGYGYRRAGFNMILIYRIK